MRGGGEGKGAHVGRGRGRGCELGRTCIVGGIGVRARIGRKSGCVGRERGGSMYREGARIGRKSGCVGRERGGSMYREGARIGRKRECVCRERGCIRSREGDCAGKALVSSGVARIDEALQDTDCNPNCL